MSDKEKYLLVDEGINPFTGEKFVDIDVTGTWVDDMNDARNPNPSQEEVDRLSDELVKLRKQLKELTDE